MVLMLLAAAPQLAQADYDYEYFHGNWNSLPDFSSLTPESSGTVQGFDISPRTQNDYFGFRFVGNVTVTVAGVYGFSTTSDDGSQLWIDGTLVVDNDGLHGSTRVEAFQFLGAGTHAIEVTFFEKTGGQVLDVQYAPPGAGFRAIPSDGLLEGPENPGDKGAWGPIIPWPHVPVSAANLPDGRILTWASNERYSFPGSVGSEFTFTAVWDPADNSIVEIDQPGHDMFCAHQVMLEDGKVFVAGGRNQGQTPFTSVFDADTNQWIPLNDMQRGRWYPTAVIMADGTVANFIGSGGSNTAEKYLPDTGQWELMTGLDFNPMILNYSSSQYGERNWWPLLHLAPNGQIFHAGPTPQMHWIDTTGVGASTPVGSEFTDWYPKHGTIVMYDEGKLISAGGWVQGTSIASTDRVMTIDISGAVPIVEEIDPMLSPRKFQNGVMLPNGEVLVVGGNTSGQKFNDSGTVLQAEVWNPTTGAWRWMSAMSVPRNYHSIALLLPDATVLSAGGGLCNCSADHADGQVFSPPYLFNPDGSPATRPAILSAPVAVRPGDSFQIVADSDITHFSAVKMSSTTHAMNTDLRYLPISFTGSAGTYQLTAHSNPNVLTPGYWMLFALNAQGTPSIAHVIQVRSFNEEDPTPESVIDFEFDSLADLSAFQVNPAAAGVGGALRLTDGSGQAGSGFYRTPVLLGVDTSFTTRLEFRIGGPGDDGDGMAFVLQGNASTALGTSGQGLGYGGLINSLAIEMDTDQDAAGDTNGNHIAVHLAGDTDTPEATATAPFNLEDGNAHTLWVDYDGTTNTLDIYLAEPVTEELPASPLLSVSGVDLPVIVGSQGYFGFTGGTGPAGTHDVEAWSLAVGTGSEPLVVQTYVPTPQPSDGPASFSASATGTGVEYRWSFGDGSPQTGWSSSSTIEHVYAAPGRYFVTLDVRDVNGNQDSQVFVHGHYPPVTATPPRSSNSLLFESATGNDRVWNVNPDNDSVTVIDAAVNLKLAEIPVGDDPRSLALAPDGRVWVVNKDSATISIIGTASLAVEATYALAPASRPYAVVIDELGGAAFVSLEGLGRVVKLDVATGNELASLDTGPDPRHLSLTDDRGTLYVSRFITPMLPGEDTTNPTTVDGLGNPVGGEILVVSTATMAWTDTVVLEHSFDQPSEQTGPGLPNYLGPAVIAPSGQNAWVASKQDNVLRGTARNGNHLDHDHSVRAITSTFDLGSAIEDLGGRVDHDNASVASSAAFGLNDLYLFVPLEGNRQVAVIDVFANEELLRFDVGFAPQAVVVSADGNRLYVYNFLDRTVTVADIAQLVSGASETVNIEATISTVASEALAADILQGKKLFYDARDPRITLEAYMSCASCHHDGSHDGRVWDFTGFGEGLRNTIALEGHAGVGQGRLHWSANFDEVHDFENQMRGFNLGLGLMSNPDFAATEPTLGAPKAGYSVDLDALSAYVSSLTTFGTSPYRDAGGVLTAEGEAGKLVFEAANCASCHTGASYTDSANDTVLLHDVGTLKGSSGQRMGGPLTGLDTPTLKGLWATAPYLHDGSAATVQAAVAAHDVASQGGTPLSSADLDAVEAYLLQIDDAEAANTVPVLDPISPPGIVENATDSIPLSASDADGDNLTFSEAGLPAFATLIDNGDGSGRIDLAPLGGDAGTYPVTVTVTDDGPGPLSASQSFDLVISDGIQPPVLAPIGDRAVTEGQSLTINILATDIDGDVLTITESGVPPFGSFTDNGNGTATIDVLPPGGVVGTYPITVTVTDDSASALADSETFDLQVVNNQAPVVATVGTQTVVEGGSLTFNVSATDADGDNLTLSETGLPPFASFTDNGNGTATITVTPDFGDALGSPYAVTIQATDDGIGALFDTESFQLQITDGNQPPVLEPIGNQSVAEGGSLTIALSASDGDGDGLTLIESGLPAFGSFTDNGDGTGSITLLPASGDANNSPYSITVTVIDDGAGLLVDSETFELTVVSVNQAPVLTLLPAGDMSVAEGAEQTMLISATDGDGNNLAFSEAGLPSFASLTDNGDGTGQILVSPQAGDSGSYPVTVFVDDDGSPSMGDSSSFTLTVYPGGPASFMQDSGTGLLVFEAENFSLNTAASGFDPWQVIGQAAASNATAIAAPTGPYTGVPGETSAEYPMSLVQAGNYYIWIRFRSFDGGSDSLFVEVDDLGALKVTIRPYSGAWEWLRVTYDPALTAGLHTAKLHVREPRAQVDKVVFTQDAGFLPTGIGPAESAQSGGGSNSSPVLASIGPQTVVEGGSLTINLSASDDDGDNITLSESGLPGFASFTDNGNGTGLISVNPALGDAVGSPYPITVTATDDNPEGPLSANETFMLTVSYANTPPVLEPIGNQSVLEDASLTIALTATDADGDNLTLSQTGVPGFGSFTDNGDGTGEIVLSPLAGDAGTYPITVYVDDDGTPAQQVSESFTVTVSPSGTLVFQQDPGSPLVMEAENFATNTGGNGVGPWLVINEANASDLTAIKAPTGTLTGAPDTSVTEYSANLVDTGTYYVWLRFRSFNGGSDSVFVEVDNLGAPKFTLRPYSGAWEWAQLLYGHVDAGIHTIRVQRRESNAEVDKVILTTDAGYVPTGLGPAQSPLVGGGGNLPPVLTMDPAGNQTVAEDASATIDLSWSDANGDGLTLSETGLPAFATLTDNGDGTGTLEISPQAGDAGSYPVEMTVTDDGTPPLADTEAFTIIVTAGGSSVIQQEPSGLLVIEAESFSANQGGNGVGPWEVISEGGASNGTAIKAPTGLLTGAPDTSRTEYQTSFNTAGTYYVWLRFRSFDGGSNSLYVEVDDLGALKVTLNPPSGTWEWLRVAYGPSLAVGPHTFKLHRRESGAEVDKAIFTADPGYVPAGIGPPQSP